MVFDSSANRVFANGSLANNIVYIRLLIGKLNRSCSGQTEGFQETCKPFDTQKRVECKPTHEVDAWDLDSSFQIKAGIRFVVLGYQKSSHY